MLRRALLGLIRFYQVAVSPWMPPACRFQPTCSAYALEAVDRYGGLRGGWLALRRLLRCHPWGGSGFDPVPEIGSGGRDRKDSRVLPVMGHMSVTGARSGGAPREAEGSVKGEIVRPESER